MQALQQEWLLLQKQFDRYESWSLVIKLAHIIVAVSMLMSSSLCLVMPIIGAIFWLQDGIWKTFQSRIESRLLVLEHAIEHSESITPFQFNSAFFANRGGAIALIKEYLTQSLKPTVAYPHSLLVIIYLVVVCNQ